MDDLAESDITAVNARAQAFKRSGDPADLWPDVNEHARLAALAGIETCVAAVLRGGTTIPALDGDAAAIGIAGLTSGTGPLLGLWAEIGRIAVSAETGAVLSRHLAHGRARAQRLEGGLRDALDALARDRVAVTVLKGMHTARRYYPEPGVRPMNDIDLLVRPRGRRDAERALERAGWRRGERQRRPYKCDWMAPGVDRRVRSLTYVHTWEPWTVELHESLDRTMAPGRQARLPLRSSDDEAWTIAGHAVRVLKAPLLVAHLAVHAAEESHRARLLRIVELVLVCREERSRHRLVWTELGGLLSATGTGGFAYPAFAFAERLVPGTIDAAVLADCATAAGPRVRALVEADTPADRTMLERVPLAEKFMWSRGPMDHARRLAVMLWPKSTGSLGDLVRTYMRRVNRLSRGRAER
jgi:hypothetical protein